MGRTILPLVVILAAAAAADAAVVAVYKKNYVKRVGAAQPQIQTFTITCHERT